LLERGKFIQKRRGSEIEEYHEVIASQAGQSRCSPVVVDAIKFDLNEDNSENKSGYNLPGMLLLWGIMMLNRKNTRRFLRRRYSNSDLLNFFPNKVAYNTIRAASILSGELAPAPDAVSVMARISCAECVFHQWNVSVYQGQITPIPGSDEELQHTAYDIPARPTPQRPCSVEYDLASLWSRLVTKMDDCHLVDFLKKNRYGILFDQLDVSEYWLFDPLEEAKKALAGHNNGFYPSIEVTGELLIPSFEAVDFPELRSLVDNYVSGLSGDKDDKEHSARCIALVYEYTICSRTAFNPSDSKLGRPLLRSYTPKKASSGGYTVAAKKWTENETWPTGCETFAISTKIGDSFKKLGTDEGKKAMETLDALCLYVFSKSAETLIMTRPETHGNNITNAAIREDTIVSDDDDDDDDDDDSEDLEDLDEVVDLTNEEELASDNEEESL
jgi:hypothetical protein